MELPPDHFEVNIVDYPERYLVGLRIRTTIPRSSIDCPPLWEKLKSRMNELPGAAGKKSYALFIMVDQRITFDHWAAVEMPRSCKIPKEMQCVELPAGKYVRCFVPNSAALLFAHSYLYSNWPHTQDKYDVDMSGPCFELYPPQWKPNEAFDLFVSVVPQDKDRLMLR